MATLPETLSGLVRHLSVLELELSKLDSQLQSEFSQYDSQVREQACKTWLLSPAFSRASHQMCVLSVQAPNPYALLIKLHKLRQ